MGRCSRPSGPGAGPVTPTGSPEPPRSHPGATPEPPGQRTDCPAVRRPQPWTQAAQVPMTNLSLACQTSSRPRPITNRVSRCRPGRPEAPGAPGRSRAGGRGVTGSLLLHGRPSALEVSGEEAPDTASPALGLAGAAAEISRSIRRPGEGAVDGSQPNPAPARLGPGAERGPRNPGSRSDSRRGTRPGCGLGPSAGLQEAADRWLSHP